MKIINPFEGKFELSKEQLHITTECMKPENKVLAIEAVAGSSKTSSLVVVSHNLKLKGMFLTFSKALATEAKGEFPLHIDCRTIHSLAYKFVGVEYQHKLNRPKGAYKNLCGTGKEISMYFKISPIEVCEEEWITSAYIGSCVKNCLSVFENSWDTTISADHVMYSDIKAMRDKHKNLFTDKIEKKLVTAIVKYSKKLWKLRSDVKSPILCTHDTYQKLYALSEPKIDTELLLLDEVQDATKVFIGVVLDQIKHGHCKVVLVGDRDQSIYGWRGSVMMNDFIKGDVKTCHLTHSFRYGQKVADIAMKILDNGKSIVGFDKADTKVEYCLNYQPLKKLTYLFRTNAVLIETALELIEDEQKVNIEIDLADYLNLLDSINALKQGKLQYVKHSDVLAYETWESFAEDVVSNPPIKRVFDIVERGDYWRVKQLLQNHENHPDNKFTLSTAHKSKGMTYENVLLAEDFPSNFNKEGKWVGLKDEDKRLLYVACTRAKNVLGYNSTVKEILEYEKVVDDGIKTLVDREYKDLKKLIPSLNG